VPMLWGGGGGLGACPEGVPRAGEPQEKELCAGPPAALGYIGGSGGGGMVFPGGLSMAPVSLSPHNNNNNNNNNNFNFIIIFQLQSFNFNMTRHDST
jgi:hypothetical protein